MDQNTLRQAVVCDPFADNEAVAAAVAEDASMEALLSGAREVDLGLKELANSSPIPPRLYEKLLTLPDTDSDFSGSVAPVESEQLLERLVSKLRPFRLAIALAALILTALGVSLLAPG